MPWPEILGHERQLDLLERALARHRLPPALLFAGPSGVGKRSLALGLAKRLLCGAESGRPCGRCHHCRLIEHSLADLARRRKDALEDKENPVGLNLRLHPDLIVVEPWPSGGKRTIKVEQARDLNEQINGLPFEARARVVVIDEAEALGEQAANALLKSLEEPPASSHVVLVTSAPQALLPTIRSRCQVLRFERLPLALIERHLVETREVAPAEARLRALLSDGSLAEALRLDSEAYQGLRDGLVGLLEQAASEGAAERLERADDLKDADLPLALTTLRSLLRDLAVLRAGAPERVLHADLAARLEPLSRGPLGARAGELAEAAAESLRALRGNASKALVLDLLLDQVGLAARG